MAYAGDFAEIGRRVADDVHQILNGVKPGDIPIYLGRCRLLKQHIDQRDLQSLACQPTKFALVITSRAAGFSRQGRRSTAVRQKFG